MRVALFSPRFPPALGGAEAYAQRLAAFHAHTGDTVTVWTSTADALGSFWQRQPHEFPAGREMNSDGVNVHRFAPVRFPLRRYLLKACSLVPVPAWQSLVLPASPLSPSMWRETTTTTDTYDVVHALAFPYAFPLRCALRLARRQNATFALTPFLHLGDLANPRDRTRRQYLQPALVWLLRQADIVFAQTEPEAEAIREVGVLQSRIVVQGMGVEPAECTGGDRDTARRAWGLRQGEVAIGLLANQSIEKGSVDLLETLANVPNVVLILAGPQMPNFRAAWDRFGLRDRVRLLGPLSDAARRDFYAGIDLFALPSRSDSFGLVILEAWANGKPVVAYRAGGPGGLIQHERDGLLVACGDRHGLAEALQRLSADDGLRTRLGTAGRTRAIAEFRWPDKLRLVRDRLRDGVGELLADR